MPIGLNPVLPILLPASSPSGETDDPSAEEPGETDQSGASGAGGVASTEQSSNASSSGQTSEARATQTVQPVSSDVAIGKFDRSDLGRMDPLAEQDDLAARKLAMKARSESIVAAMVEAISAPINARELDLLSGSEETNDPVRTETQANTEQFEEGLSAIRDNS